MPRIKTKNTKATPAGFDKIKPTLIDFDIQLKELQDDKASRLAANADQGAWKVFQLSHERTRYVYDLYYKRKAISKELYEWLLREKYADKMLIAKWKKKGYEKLCCLRCIQTSETAQGNTCICRVPRATLEKNSKDGVVTFTRCVHCGCSGCASTD
ncbi:U2 snRNP complex subunit BUD31 [Lachancea thermotolerans CBS 6340]|uniref:KLTH0A06512p n=1 Tax=Lachancea thermotolerans (strain ATCC 56472 / CBS 6340 / NRRL Y-8284) TaxID=559295 RepID=C5DBZ1_LACTC|nr:KLTH0A06512p [Lachancea thermotolerans CBS 6340]CAR21298.1 KLTH0A06512p [Lachancea thermotolerans CBS 6340]